MDVRQLLMNIVVGLPLVAIVVMLFSGAEISERHHLHHDTYTVSQVVSRTLTLVMLFMGMLGSVTGWLCRLGVFSTDSLIPLTFFVTFLLTLFVMLLMVARYQVMAYDDRMVVRPAFGRIRTVEYDEIERMEWVRSMLSPYLSDLKIWSRDGRSSRIWCFLDIEQLLMRIDRFDVLGD